MHWREKLCLFRNPLTEDAKGFVDGLAHWEEAWQYQEHKQRQRSSLNNPLLIISVNTNPSKELMF